MFPRRRLKLGLLACLIVLAASAIAQTGWTFARPVDETFFFVEIGSAVSAFAICLALIATA